MKKLKEWRYRCQGPKIDCRHVTVLRFPEDYKPFTKTMMTCGGCHKYTMHRLLASHLSTREDVRFNG